MVGELNICIADSADSRERFKSSFFVGIPVEPRELVDFCVAAILQIYALDSTVGGIDQTNIVIRDSCVESSCHGRMRRWQRN